MSDAKSSFPPKLFEEQKAKIRAAFQGQLRQLAATIAAKPGAWRPFLAVTYDAPEADYHDVVFIQPDPNTTQ